MKGKIIIGFTVIILLCIGCSKQSDEFIVMEERLANMESEFSSVLTIQDDINELHSEIESLKISVDKLKDDMLNDSSEEYSTKIKELGTEISRIDSEVSFLTSMTYGWALFDRNEIVVGDFASNMRLVEITNYKGKQFIFEGEKYLTGKYSIQYDDFMFGEIVTFSFDDKVTDVLPREIDDGRDLWFGFSNIEDAIELLSPYGDSGTITILIDQYEVDLTAAAVYNKGRIVDVIVD